MSVDSYMVETMFQALLDHFWRARDASTPRSIEIFPKGYCLPYGKLIELAKVPINPRSAGGYLFHIAEKCRQLEWAPIHSLVVNKELGMPGEGFYSAPGTKSLPFDPKEWEHNALSCIDFDFPRVAPKIP